MRPLVVFTALAIVATLAPTFATADPSPPAQLLWKHQRDGTTEGWTVSGAATLTPFSDGMALFYGAGFPPGEARSPSFPAGAREAVLSLSRSTSVGTFEVFARDANGADLLAIQTTQQGKPCVVAACDTRTLALPYAHLTIHIGPDGWRVAHDKHVFASGPEDLGVLDHVALGRGGTILRDLRVYGTEAGIDEPLRTRFGAFEDRMDLRVFGEEAATLHSRGAWIEAREWETRTLLAAPVPEGRWYFQENVLVFQGPDTAGYAIVAGLDANGETLWRIGLGHTNHPIEPDMWHLTLVEGSRVETLAEVGRWDAPDSAHQWSRRVAALADPAAGSLVLRVERDVLPAIQLPSLAATAYVAFGDADVVPVLVGNSLQTGIGASHHEDVVVASVAPSFGI